MNMKTVRLPVKDRAEATAIQTAMADPTTRAMVVTMGLLMQLPTDGARRRVLVYVADKLREHQLDQTTPQLEDEVRP